MAKSPLKEGRPGAEVAARKIRKAACHTHVEVSEREKSHDCQKNVLEARGSLQHKKDWLKSSSQSWALKGIVERYFLGWLAMIWSLILSYVA